MLNYFATEDFDRTVYTVTDDREVESHTLGELCRQYADTTTTPEGVGPRAHIRNDTELWAWGTGGQDRKLVYTFQTKEQAEHGLLLSWRWDLTNANADTPPIFDTQAEAEGYIKDLLCDEADELLFEAQDKGVCALPRTGVWLCSAEHMQEEQKGWDENDGSKNIDFTASKFWLSANDGALEAVSEPEDLIPYLKKS